MKKIPVKNLYLLLVIGIGLIGLGIGSTYAIFTTSAQIDNPIALKSNLTYESNIIETIEINIPSGETKQYTINVDNANSHSLNYVTWYMNTNSNIDIISESGNATGILESGSTVSIIVDIKNNSNIDETVLLGVSSSTEDIVLGENMNQLVNSYIEFIVTPENRHMIGYTGEENEELVIPSTFKDDNGTWYKVVEIGDSAFQDSNKLTSVVIPDTVTIINQFAFYQCSSLETIVLSEKLLSIGYNAFGNCTSLSNVEIPSVEEIASYAFTYCKSLEIINLPDNLIYIGNGAFYYAGLVSISIPAGVSELPSWIFTACKNLVDVNLPDTIEIIGEEAFAGTGIEEFTFPKSVTIVENNIFHNNYNLKKVIFHDNISVIEYAAFYNCYNLKEIIFGNGISNIVENAFYVDSETMTTIYGGNDIVTNYNWTGDNRAIATATDIFTSNGAGTITGLTEYGSTLTHIEIPEEINGQVITAIGDRAFRTRELTSVNIPDSVTYIGDGAFEYSSIESINISANVNYIGYYAFGSCINLKDINVDFKNLNYSSIDGALFNKDGTHLIVIPSGKNSYTIPASVINISEYAIYYSDLESIDVDPQNQYYISLEGVLYTKDMKTLIAYPSGNKNLVFYVPNGVNYFRTGAIAYSLFTEMYIPKSVIEIKSYNFWGTKFKNVYYEGDESQWNAISMDRASEANSYLNYAVIHYSIDMQ